MTTGTPIVPHIRADAMERQARYTWDSASNAHADCTLLCSWSWYSVPKIVGNTSYLVVDVLVQAKTAIDSNEAGEHLSGNKHPKACGLLDAILGIGGHGSNFTIPVKLLLPSFDGYFVQQDIIQDRFVDSEVVCAVHRLAGWDQKTRAVTEQILTSEGLAAVVGCGAAALIGHKSQPTGRNITSERHEIEDELHHRLQLEWWLPDLPPTRTLAFVMAGVSWTFYGPIHKAAQANRIQLVIIDEPDHWLNEPSNSHLREHFLPVSLNDDDGQLSARIVDEVRKAGLHLDGILAFRDVMVMAVCEAAVVLGIPTQPPASYLLCRDKHATHRLRTGNLLNALVTTDEQALALTNDSSVQYPLVVKPQRGTRSEGVTKITKPSQILPAIRHIRSELRDSAVVETYFAGPEIDVNLVLCNGRVLFSEVVDNEPCQGDDDTPPDASRGTLPPRNFSETGMNSPSALPLEERSMAQVAAYDAVIAAGFTTGVFHVEGRIVHSKMRYERINGQAHLRPVPTAACHQDASFALIEINPRPPGFPLNIASKRAVGIDYIEQAFFAAMQDYDRMCGLARPFTFPGLDGAQYWSRVYFPLVLRAGPFDARAWRAMIASHPHAFDCMSVFDSMWSDGQEMPDPLSGRSRALAFFVMYTRESHQKLMEVVSDVQRQLEPSLATGLARKK